MNLTKNEAKSTGLSRSEVEESRKKNGSNLLSKQRGKSFSRRFLENLNDPVIRILLGAMLVNLLLLFRASDWIETLGIGLAVLLATLISTLSEYGSEQAFARLSAESAKIFCRVRRDYAIKEVPISDLVVGDCVLLSQGDPIPADGELTFGALQVDQAALTGENREVKKVPCAKYEHLPACSCAVFRGCNVTGGGGEMIVRAVGDKSFLGGISREIQAETRESPLHRRLSRLAHQISKIGYLASVLVALAYLFQVFFLKNQMNPTLILAEFSNLQNLFAKLLHAFTLGLTVLVVAVPEGLPMMIAVVLSSNVRKMEKDHVLVRKSVGIESAGSMNILFTDKTGTLTEGKMKLSGICFADGSVKPLKTALKEQNEAAKLMCLAFLFGTDAVIGVGKDGKKTVLGGSGTERALLESVSDCPCQKGNRIFEYLPFTSDRKYSAVSLTGNQHSTFLIGAPEKLFPNTDTKMLPSGDVKNISKGILEAELKKQTKAGYRVLAVAVSNDGIPAKQHSQSPCGSLCFLGFALLKDEIRKGAKESVLELQRAGIHTVMMTGDNPDTAREIAESCHILTKEWPLLLTGQELARLSDFELKEKLPSLAVISRALPSDKSRLVRIAEECGLVVGMTGDGINDAPALRSADVGFAMGSGTQVAKDAGDIIILDNRLSSIAKAVLYGRTVFKSIRKFITLQLTMNFCAVGVTMICPFLGIESPVTVVQMLWINLIMDTLGGLAFAGEAPLEDDMKEPPKRRDEPILNRYMVNEILTLGGFTVILDLCFLKTRSLVALFRPAEDQIYLLTAFFALFIFSSVFNCFNARTDRLKLFSGLKKNPVFCGIMLAILAIQILFVYLGGSVLRTSPLTAKELLITGLFSLSVFPAELIRKLVWKWRGEKKRY